MPSIAGAMIREAIPDRGPGHAFIVIAHPGCGRHTKVWILATLVGGIVRVAFVPPLRPLDSGFRRKDEVGRQQDKMCRAPVEDVMVLTWDNLVRTKDEKKGRRRCVDVGGGIAIDVLSRDVSAWILAPDRSPGHASIAGMTNGGSLAQAKAV